MILEFYLKDFIPLRTSNVLEIKMITRDQINLFVSQNGAGKSSVLREMNPFPPDTSKFNEGGIKRISLLKDGKVYTMTSVIGKEGYHHFEVDGVNLNTGCTATAQRMLAETHFGISQSTARILSGLHITDLFNVMSPAKRKDFLMDLYPNDTTYAMGVYNKLKEEFNNSRGALRNQIARYAIEKQTLEAINSLSETELLNRIENLDSEIREGLLLVGRLSGGKESSQLHAMHNSLLTLASSLLRSSVKNPEGLTRAGLKLRISETEERLRVYQSRQNHAAKELAELNEQSSLKDIKQDPKLLQARIVAIGESLTYWINKRDTHKESLKEHATLMDAYSEQGSRFVVGLSEMKTYLSNITVVSSDTITRVTYQESQAKLEKMINEKNRYQTLLVEKQHKLSHYKGMVDVNCPKCDHTFKEGITEGDIIKLENDIKGITKTLELYAKQIVLLEVAIENDKEWFLSMQALHQFICTQRYTTLDLGAVIREYGIGKTDATVLLNAINSLSLYDEALENIKPLEQEQIVTQSQINLLSQNYIGGLLTKIKNTEDDLNWCNRGIRLIQRKLNADRYTLNQMNVEENNRIEFATKIAVFKQTLQSDFDARLKDEVNLGISQRTGEKNHCMSEIIRHKSLSSVVENIDADIQRLKKRIKIVKTLMDGLCPNKGLIGKLMLDFIKTFCGNANAIIKEFSNITLLLKPCNKDNGDLTYKFPVVNGNNTEASDVSDCSAGESEIINWVVRKVGMRYKPSWFPMFMDEVGAFLDEINRQRFFTYVQQIMNDKEHEQLFMISHYVSQHGMFNNPNIISINSEGLTVTGKVNTHTTIQRV